MIFIKYYALHKEELYEKRKEKYQEIKKFNKENNIVIISEKFNCICGAIIVKKSISRHEKNYITYKLY
jgi:hypothetical protein